MVVLLVFAFLAGIVTILSPCILPLLPIILSGTVGGGHKRPLGIITGFVVSFTFFTLFLSAIVQATGISADILRTISVIVIAVFGIALITPFVQKFSETMFSKLSSLMPQQQTSSGFWGGVLIGLSLGLIWTPCVGPIIASVITLAATSSVTLSAALITLAYTTGTAIPMLLVMIGGRAALQKVPWLLQNTGKIQKFFGILMLLTAVGIYFGVDRKFQTYILDTFPEYGTGLTQLEDQDFIQEELEDMGQEALDIDGKDIQAPELIKGGQWFNLPENEQDTQVLSLEELRGKVVLVDFWTYTCINCIRTLPYLNDWHSKYADDGLVIIGVHTPEFAFEEEADNVQEALVDYGIEYPVMQDNDYATWRAYKNRFWPAKYLIDKDGYVRYTHFGEGEYDETERVIQELLRQTGTEVNEEIKQQDYSIDTFTPETYLGYGRMEYLVSPEQIIPDGQQEYTAPEILPPNRFAYQGEVMISDEYANPKEGTRLTLNFESKDVFLVMRTTDEEQGQIEVRLDNQLVSESSAGEDAQNGVLTVTTDRLYDLINLQSPGRHVLRLDFQTSNIEIFAFTFG